MTFKIFLAVALGILVGALGLMDQLAAHMDSLITLGLSVMLLLAGVEIGRQGKVFAQIRKYGLSLLLVPLSVALGSILGAIAAGMLFQMPVAEAAAIGAGFGWYSFSAVELAKHSAELGTLAFITNIARELMALVSIPFIAKHIGYLEAIAPGGATTMDTTLPLLAKSTDGTTAMIGFITGMLLSLAVPILVPMIMGFFAG